MLRVGTETLPVSRRHTRQVREQLVRQLRDRPLSSIVVKGWPSPSVVTKDRPLPSGATR
jgi:hypothetical protein